ncbi:MAG: double zinc ribbon domain-containing protein [Ruminococcus sp.]|nr:double zinc ribbon domain-containing protein [Ruminococcus sp.]
MSALYVFLRHLTALIYPARCPVCNKVIGAMDRFCDKCNSEFTEYHGNFKMQKVKKFIAVFEYNTKISPAVFLMKDGISGNAPYAFGSLIAERIKDEGINADLIVPVPMYKKDLKKRGYNQAELIAKEVGFFLETDVAGDIVVKNRQTQAQKNLTFVQRKENLKNAFSVTDTSKIKGKRIIIIDDICTTGSTLSEVANLLIDSGASEIYCACACKTPYIKRGDKNESR